MSPFDVTIETKRTYLCDNCGRESDRILKCGGCNVKAVEPAKSVKILIS